MRNKIKEINTHREFEFSHLEFAISFILVRMCAYIKTTPNYTYTQYSVFHLVEEQLKRNQIRNATNKIKYNTVEDGKRRSTTNGSEQQAISSRSRRNQRDKTKQELLNSKRAYTIYQKGTQESCWGQNE